MEIEFKTLELLEQEKIKFRIKSNNVNEIAFRRWLVNEIYADRMTINEAIQRFDFEHKQPSREIQSWLKKYKPDFVLTLPIMSEKERNKIADLEKHIKNLEKELDKAQMKGVALDTLIDIAEKQLNISIRKKYGTKQ